MNLSNAGRTRLAKVPGLNKALDFICARANNVFAVEHENETGVHTDITATSIGLDAGSPREAIGAISADTDNVAGNAGNSVTVLVDGVAVLTLQRVDDTFVTVAHETFAMVPSTPNGTGAAIGNVFSIGRNTSGNGAPGALRLTSKTGTEIYFWITTAGELRVGGTPPNEDGSIPETYGASVSTKLYAANVTVATTIGVPSNLDSFAISGLLATDKLLVVIDIATGEGNTSYLYHDTGATALTTAMAGGAEQTVAILGRSPVDANIFRVTRMISGVLSQVAPNPGVAWTGSWTIAVRDDNAAGGTKHVSWGVWKLSG